MSPVSRAGAGSGGPRVALVTYSTKARGGVAHTLSLAEALAEKGMRVRVVALGEPGDGFYRPVRAPHSLVPTPPRADTLERRGGAAPRAPGIGVAGNGGGGGNPPPPGRIPPPAPPPRRGG